MKAKKLLIATLFTSVAAVAIGAFAFVAPKIEAEGLKATGGAYTCASLHFGMVDNASHTGGVADVNLGGAGMIGLTCNFGTTENLYDNTLGTANGVTVTQYTTSKTSSSGANVWHDGDGTTLKMKGGTVSWTFTANVIAVDVYAVGWNKDSVTLKVNNGTAQSIASDSSIASTGTVEDFDFTERKYHFDFSETNKITLVSTNRIIIADIAIRLA